MPIKPGQEATVDYEYVRHGVVNIFMANEPLKGKRFVVVTEFKTKKDWAKFVKVIADKKYPAAKKTTLVMDNFKTHAASAFYETFDPMEAKRLWDRFEFVYTPKHGSWLNMAEIELHVLNGQCLNRHICSMKKIKDEINAWQKHRNNKNNKINWQFANNEFQPNIRENENDRINSIYQYSIVNYKRKIQMEEVAALACMSPNSFCRFFKSKTRKTYSSFLIEIRVGIACKLLIANNLSIKQICYESGFNNFASFHKYFKMITNKTPLNYQREFISKNN